MTENLRSPSNQLGIDGKDLGKEGEVLTPKEVFVLRLIEFRDDWEKTYGTREQNKKDGHAQWYTAITAEFENAKETGILPKKAETKVDNFFRWYQKYGESKSYPVVDNPNEIEYAKNTLNIVIRSFKVEPEPLHDVKDDLIQHLQTLRNYWFDGIPNRIVHSIDGPWKIRANWRIGIAIDLSIALDKHLIPDNIREDVENFINWHLNYKENHKFIVLPRYGRTYINTKADIEKGNEIIDKVLKSFT